MSFPRAHCFPTGFTSLWGACGAPHSVFRNVFRSVFRTVFRSVFRRVFRSIPKRFPKKSKGRHLPSEPSKKGCRRTIGSNPKVTANCFNLKLYVPWTLQLAFWAQCWYFGRSNAKYASKRQRRGGVLKVLQLPQNASTRFFTCKWPNLCSKSLAGASRVSISSAFYLQMVLNRAGSSSQGTNPVLKIAGWGAQGTNPMQNCEP